MSCPICHLLPTATPSPLWHPAPTPSLLHSTGSLNQVYASVTTYIPKPVARLSFSAVINYFILCSRMKFLLQVSMCSSLCLVPTEARKRQLILWKGNHRHSWNTIWMLGTKLSSLQKQLVLFIDKLYFQLQQINY